MNVVMLYHGGIRAKVESILAYGLLEREFFCTRQKAVAVLAACDYGCEGRVLELCVPKHLFDWAEELRYFIDRPYLGSITIESAREVVINPPFGTRVLNGVIRLQGRIRCGERVDLAGLQERIIQEAMEGAL